MLSEEQTVFFSIVVPVYGSPEYFRKCVDSVLCQKNVALELILVDDESPDECPRICDESALNDKRVKVIHQKNSGIAAACNAGLSVAKGDYIIQLDNDDYLANNVLEKISLQIVKNNMPDVLQCNWARDLNGTLQDHLQILPKNGQNTDLSRPDRLVQNFVQWKIPVPFWSRAVKRSFLETIAFRFESKYDGIQDLDGFFKCYLMTDNIWFYDEVLSIHRESESSFSVAPSYRMLAARIDFFSDYFNRADELSLSPQYAIRYKEKIAYLASTVCDTVYKLNKGQRKMAYKRMAEKGDVYRFGKGYHCQFQDFRFFLYRNIGCAKTHMLMDQYYGVKDRLRRVVHRNAKI